MKNDLKMSKEDKQLQQQPTVNQTAWILNYQPTIEHQHVYLDGRRVDTAEAEEAEIVESSAGAKGQGRCDVLRSDRAVRLWQIALEAGWVDEQWQPRLSRTLSAVLADHMASLLGIRNKWKTFEAFWHRSNMRGDYNDALEQLQYGKFREKMLRLMPAGIV